MISLDLTKSSEVRKAGDGPNCNMYYYIWDYVDNNVFPKVETLD